MEGNGSVSIAKQEEAPVSHQPPPPPPPPARAATTPDPVLALAVVAGADSSSSGIKKKRGRPRKFGPDGLALSPMPLSASIPIAGEIPAWQPPRGMVTPVEILKNKQPIAYENPAENMARLVSANFTPHVITVHPGEDIIMKMMALSKQRGKAVFVISANGTIANFSLYQPKSSGGIVTYEGRFELITLTGSYMPIAMGGTTGRMSASLAGPDGRVFGGGLAGLFVAASPVQLVLGSFIPGHQQQQQQHQQRAIISQRPESLSDPSTMFRQETTNVAFGGGAKTIPTEEDNIVPVQSIANSLGGNKISFSANGLPSS